MGFQLDIGELTNTINEYENFIKILSEQKENINKAVKELTDLGWSGEAKDQFEQNHIKKQEFYTKLEEDIKYMKSALENDEKPKAVQLKKRSEDFENCIKRSEGGAAFTSDDTGVISLQYGGQFLINNNVNECTNDYYRKMNGRFEEILRLVNSLTFTSFPIKGDVMNAENSLRNQTTSLTEFDNSFDAYCSGVRAIEDNICSVFGKISGVTEGISKFRGVSVISEDGQVDKNKVKQLMLKNPGELTAEEKEMLEYAKIVLGEDEYKKVKEIVATYSGPTVREAAYMATDVYKNIKDGPVPKDKQDKLINGWTRIYMKASQESLVIGVYQRKKGNGMIEYAVVNKGTSSWSLFPDGDGDDNLLQLFGESHDMKNSINFAINFINNHPDESITFIGHSKGGAESAANAVVTNRNCILFNPATVNLDAYRLGEKRKKYSAKMHAYIVDGEILHGIEKGFSKPIGKVTYLPCQTKEAVQDKCSIKDSPGISNVRHSIGNKIKNIVGEDTYSELKSARNKIKNILDDDIYTDVKNGINNHLMDQVKTAIEEKEIGDNNGVE
ncbi:hypothetical protein [Clostridium brassicae]|uniref:DUF2974 domain-containing protein n=1 Tax=Clostridium brassicae TaxID=2999072 RepID=A0ABT4D766_9CLOT|nr:hypothetical protein [Clostridium brassicae]MCY6958028.1 hypothetical protein [Clostridium brassicae]